MTQQHSTTHPFSKSLTDARIEADAAWAAESDAWEAIGSKNNPSHDEVMPWYKLRAAALDAQQAFDGEIEQWRRMANLP